MESIQSKIGMFIVKTARLIELKKRNENKIIKEIDTNVFCFLKFSLL